MPSSPSQAYQLKSIRFQNAERRILLQNENGPCPLLAAANALLLRGVVTLDPSSVRNGVASADDVVNMLADRALATVSSSSHDDDDDGASKYHLNEVLGLLPDLQRGMDVNPRFDGGPSGVEYTRNTAAFDLLGVELVHGWLLDGQDRETAAVVGSRTYNQLVETVIEGNEARDRRKELDAKLREREMLLTARREEEGAAGLLVEGESRQQQTDPAGNVSIHSERESGDVSSADMIQGEESVRSKTDPEHCNDNSDNLPAKESSTASEDERASNSEQPDQVKSIGKEETANSSLNPELERHGGDSPPKTTPAVDDTVALRSEIADLHKRTTELSLLVARSEIADAFLASSSHQLTHHGLERLHAHVAEGALSVFFRNNHFATLTKREGNLYLLVSDLGYANTPEIVWERLDGIDGDTEYADEFFKRPAPRKELAPASGPTVSPELLLAQRGQAEADYRMALAMSEGATVAVPPPRTDDDEARLMEAARELSLRAYHGVEEEEDVITTTTPAATDADAEVAAAYERAQRREERDLEQDSERLARQLQELEYARQRRPMANARAATATTPARAATSNCTVS